MNTVTLQSSRNKNVFFMVYIHDDGISGKYICISSYTKRQPDLAFTFTTCDGLHEVRIHADYADAATLWVNRTAFDIDMKSADALLAVLDIRKTGTFFKQQVAA